MSPNLRFQRRKRLLGGLVHLNFSKSGVSATVGVPGARFTVPLFGGRHPRITLGAPGTGFSVSETLGDGK